MDLYHVVLGGQFVTVVLLIVLRSIVRTRPQARELGGSRSLGEQAAGWLHGQLKLGRQRKGGRQVTGEMVTLERLAVVLAPEHEYQAKFNAGMIEVDGVVHMAYRFTEKSPRWYGRPIDWSQYEIDREFPYVTNHIRYARLHPDGTLAHDGDTGVLVPDGNFDRLGCEDPRIVPFEGSIYIFYCAYDGVKTRVGVAQTDGFIRYRKLGIVPNPYADKDAFIFPRRIGGKMAYVHRVPPTIQIDYFDSMAEMLAPEAWEGYEDRLEPHTVLRGAYPFDEAKLGGGVPPIETAHGWLFIYHGVDSSKTYSACAALLDLDNPSRVISRLPYPVLSPAADYEVSGDYRGCVFPQGAFVSRGELFVSYGAADKYVAVARVRLERLLAELTKYAR